MLFVSMTSFKYVFLVGDEYLFTSNEFEEFLESILSKRLRPYRLWFYNFDIKSIKKCKLEILIDKGSPSLERKIKPVAGKDADTDSRPRTPKEKHMNLTDQKIFTNVVVEDPLPVLRRSCIRYFPSSIIENIKKGGKGSAIFISDLSVEETEIRALGIR